MSPRPSVWATDRLRRGQRQCGGELRRVGALRPRRTPGSFQTLARATRAANGWWSSCRRHWVPGSREPLPAAPRGRDPRGHSPDQISSSGLWSRWRWKSLCPRSSTIVRGRCRTPPQRGRSSNALCSGDFCLIRGLHEVARSLRTGRLRFENWRGGFRRGPAPSPERLSSWGRSARSLASCGRG